LEWNNLLNKFCILRKSQWFPLTVKC